MIAISPGAIAVFLNGLEPGEGGEKCDAPIKSFDVFYSDTAVMGFHVIGEDEECLLD